MRGGSGFVPGVGYGSGFAWNGATHGTMVIVNYTNSMRMEAIALYCGGFVPFNPSGIGCDTALLVDQFTGGTPPGNITTDNSFSRIAVFNAAENDAAKFIQVSPQGLSNVERQKFDNIDFLCSGVNNPTPNTMTAFYVGNSSNAIGTELTNSTGIGCGTAIWMVNGNNDVFQGNFWENNRRDFYMSGGANVIYKNNRSETANTPAVEWNGGTNLSLEHNRFSGLLGTGTTIQLDNTANSVIELSNNSWDANGSITAIAPNTGIQPSVSITARGNFWPNSEPNWFAIDNFGTYSSEGNTGAGSQTTYRSALQFKLVPNGQNLVAPFFYPNLNSAATSTLTIPADGVLTGWGKTGDTIQDQATATSGTSADVFINSFNRTSWITASATGVTLPNIATVNIIPSIPNNGISSFAAVTNVMGLHVGTINVANSITPVNGFGAKFEAPSGAANNYSTGFFGNTLLSLGSKAVLTHGSNATAGVVTLASGTTTVSTTAIAALAAAGGAGDVVRLTLQNCSTCGTLSVGTVTPGTSFVINSTNVVDASNVFWEIMHVN
jgi:hypothetical protein